MRALLSVRGFEYAYTIVIFYFLAQSDNALSYLYGATHASVFMPNFSSATDVQLRIIITIYIDMILSIYFLFVAFQYDKVHRQRGLVVLLLTQLTIMFWLIFLLIIPTASEIGKMLSLLAFVLLSFHWACNALAGRLDFENPR